MVTLIMHLFHQVNCKLNLYKVLNQFMWTYTFGQIYV